MRRLCILTLAAMLASSVAGCGYFLSGEWDDDPKNWARAFRSSKPPDVIVVHSKFVRTPHWSYEFEYFFEIQPNPALRDQLLHENNLQRVYGHEAESAASDDACFGERPSWFAPGDPSRYEVWVYRDRPSGNFRLLVDVETQQMFVADYEV